MKFIKLDLLTLLISLFLFASCENTSTIGLELDPNSAIQGALIDTVSISSRTVADDAPTISGAARYPMGFLNDPTFGTTESSLAMTVNLPSAAYDFGNTPVVDSAVLVLNYGSQFYGDSTSTYSIDVQQLSYDFARDSSFPTTKDYPSYPTVLGNKTGKLYPTTPYKITDVVTGGPDTLQAVTPQLRIRLDKSFIENNIVGATDEQMKNNPNFTRYFGGFKVKINKTNSTGIGGIAFFDFSSDKSELTIYYRNVNATTSLPDTIKAKFPISTVSPIAATINHDHSGTAVAEQLNNPTVQYPVTYLQALGGARTKIQFPYLDKFTSNVGKVIVNKAELVVDVSAGSDVIPFNPAPRLALYRYDIAERRKNLPDNDSYTSTNAGDRRALGEQVFGGYYNPVTRQYIFVVTAYIQDLLDKKTIDYGTFLAPTPSTEFEIYTSIGAAARTVIGAFKKNPTASDNVMKLNIYYTKIN